MRRHPGRRFIALLLLSVPTLHAQTSSPVAEPDSKSLNIFRVGVDLVQVDAVVTDSRGNPVTDLTSDDFILYQDGEPQEISTFSIVREDRPRLLPGYFRVPLSRKNRPQSPPRPLRWK